MESTDWCADGRAALAAVAALNAALDSVTGAGVGVDRTGPPGSVHDGPSGSSDRRDTDPLWDDPLRVLADDCLDAMADMAR
ncbi:MAG TPA: hypothetical protein VLT34_07485, partial [Arthrobacter sp.]|nr:hypothetical protein [Arthrobacter sp.]